MALFPCIQIFSGHVRSGFGHVEQEDVETKEIETLLRIFRLPGTG